MGGDKGEKKNKKERKNGKTFLSRFPGLEILPSLPLQANDAVNDCVGFAAMALEALALRQRRYPFERRARLNWHG
jgi:hypothetical protein